MDIPAGSDIDSKKRISGMTALMRFFTIGYIDRNGETEPVCVKIYCFCVKKSEAVSFL